MLWELWGRSERQPHVSQEQKKGADWFSRKEERLGIGGVRQDHSRPGEPYVSEVWDPGLVWGNCKFLSIFRGRRVEINETKRIWMRIWPRELRPREFGQDGVGNVHHAQLSRPNPEDWSRKWQPTPVFLHGKCKNREAWCAAVHGVTQSWTQQSDWEQNPEDNEESSKASTQENKMAAG